MYLVEVCVSWLTSRTVQPDSEFSPAVSEYNIVFRGPNYHSILLGSFLDLA